MCLIIYWLDLALQTQWLMTPHSLTQVFTIINVSNKILIGECGGREKIAKLNIITDNLRKLSNYNLCQIWLWQLKHIKINNEMKIRSLFYQEILDGGK